MSSTELTNGIAAGQPRPISVPMRLEVVVIAVAEVDRAKASYERLGWRLDADVTESEEYRVVQGMPPASEASVIFGKGVTSAAPGSTDRIVLAVDDLDAAREELSSRGVEVTEPFHEANGGLDSGFHGATADRSTGRDPEGRSCATYAEFSDPDGNRWLLQELTERLPGCVDDQHRGISQDCCVKRGAGTAHSRLRPSRTTGLTGRRSPWSRGAPAAPRRLVSRRKPIHAGRQGRRAPEQAIPRRPRARGALLDEWRNKCM